MSPKPASFLAIDVGGTKTLVAVFSYSGEIVAQQKIKTPAKYTDFIKQLRPVIDDFSKTYDIKAVCCALPGEIDRKKGIGVVFGNLTWRNVPAAHNISKIIKGLPVLLENDAKLAALSEAILKHKRYSKVLYLTISTGIGAGVIIDGKISHDLIDAEPGQMMLEHEGNIKRWEDIASGRALVARYGKKASEQDDPKVWQAFAHDLALGLQHVLAVVQPDLIIIGGSVGNYFQKFKNPLEIELKKLENNLVDIPPITQAERAEEAVVYGCYEYIKQNA